MCSNPGPTKIHDLFVLFCFLFYKSASFRFAGEFLAILENTLFARENRYSQTAIGKHDVIDSC